MPVLIRIIAQRLLVFILGFLAFLGINPNINIPSIEEIKAGEEQQTKSVKEIFNTEKLDQNKISKALEDIKQNVDSAAEKITEKQNSPKEFVEETVNVPKLKITDSKIETESNFIEDVVVNIVCITRTPGSIQMTTGSGVIVSPSGIIITNSHVANNFLFNDERSEKYKNCSVRRENIPTYGFNAELIYLPADWLIENQNFFLESSPRGSGENDYALLAITTNTNPTLSVPSTFNYAQLITSDGLIDTGKEIIVAAYPGQNSGIFEVDSKGRLRQANTYISELITFNKDEIDLISTGPNEVAKKGSSGGGVFMDNKLVGIITTTDSIGSDSYLNAITISYIFRDYQKDQGASLFNIVNGDKNSLIQRFKNSYENNLKSLIADFL